MLYINIDASYYEFKINEKYYIDASLVVLLKYNQWKTLVNYIISIILMRKKRKKKSINRMIKILEIKGRLKKI